MSGFSPWKQAIQEGKTTMFYPEIHEQTILEIPQGDYVGAKADSILIDRQARDYQNGMSPL
jgi:hypothetical protein